MEGHITKGQIQNYYKNNMDNKEKYNMLDHVSQCDGCSLKLWEELEKNGCEMPPFLKSEIMEKIKKKEEISKFQLLFYSLKVGAAIAGAIILTFAGSNMESFTFSSIDKINGTFFQVNDSFRNWNSQILERTRISVYE